jgi:hypothetical protein
MSMLFAVKGSVTNIGQSLYNNNAELFAYIEITEPSGRRVMIEKIAVSNDVGAALAMGVTGEFFVDRIFRSGELRCQIWGIKTHDREILDRKNLRLQVSFVQLLHGLLTIPVLGLGLLIAVPALVRLFGCVGEPRQRMFYGSGVSRARTPAEQVVRI